MVQEVSQMTEKVVEDAMLTKEETWKVRERCVDRAQLLRKREKKEMMMMLFLEKCI